MKIKSLLLTAFLLIGSMLSVFSQVPNYVPSNGLQAWLSFDGDGNDLSSNGNNALNAGASFVNDRNGNASSAAYFDGTSNSYMQITSPTFQFSATGEFTYSFWMKKETQTTAAGIVMMSGTNTSGVFITLIQGASNFTFGTNKQQSSWAFLSCAHTLNNWDHYVTTYNAGMMHIYKNGVQQGMLTNTQTGATTQTNPFYIARGLNTSGNYKGALDDLGIWDRELSQSEINTLFTGITAVAEVEGKANFLVYPNPSKDFIELDVDATFIEKNYLIFNLSGKKVLEGKINSLSTRIPLNGIPCGVYTIELNNDQSSRYKFVKQSE